jgi:branched-chain amino acid transport system substrate-binding protein
MMSWTKRARWVTGGLVAALVLSACGSGAEEAPDVDPAGTAEGAGDTETEEDTEGEEDTGEAVDGADVVVNGPGITDDAIKLGVNIDLSGPAAAPGIDAAAGFQVYFDWLNDQGGIAGRQIEVITEDHTYDPTVALNNWERLVRTHDIFGGMCFGTPSCISIGPRIVEEQRPHIMISQAAAFYDPQEDFVLINGIPYSWEAAITIDYIVEEYGAEKIGVAYQDDDFGRDGLRGAEEAAEYHGIELISEPYERGATDFSSQVAALRRADVEWVLTSGVVVEPAAIVRAIRNLDWDVRKGSLVAATMQPATLGLGDPGDFEGYIGPSSWAFPTDDEPGVQEMLERAAEYAPDHEPSTYFIYGYVNALIFAEGLQGAADAGELSPQAVVDAWYQIDGLESGGLYSPISLSRERPFPGTSASITEVQDGQFVRITEPRSPVSLDTGL